MYPFQNGGNTFAIAATTSSSTAVQIADMFALNSTAYSVRIYNAGPNDVFINLANPAAAAVVPTPGSPQSSYPLPVGAVEVCSAGPDTFITTICATGTATVYCTPGFGV